MFSNHNWIKLDINVKWIDRPSEYVKNALLKNSWVKGETQIKTAEFLDNNDNQNATYQNL